MIDNKKYTRENISKISNDSAIQSKKWTKTTYSGDEHCHRFKLSQVNLNPIVDKKDMHERLICGISLLTLTQNLLQLRKILKGLACGLYIKLSSFIWNIFFRLCQLLFFAVLFLILNKMQWICFEVLILLDAKLSFNKAHLY